MSNGSFPRISADESMFDIAIVGGGIVGLAIAHELSTGPNAGRRIVVLEKERRVATQQSGHNSGVVHAGVYYRPGSLKAELCTTGRQMLREFCEIHAVPYETCGKLVVATGVDELEQLDEIERRARENGVSGLRRLDGAAATEIEPHVTALEALHSPGTAIVDFAAVCDALARRVSVNGGDIRCDAKVTAMEETASGVSVSYSTTGDAESTDAAGGSMSVTARQVILCGGLQSDQLSKLAGGTEAPMIIPFRGGYHELIASRRFLVRGLIYPVPDPRYPFLGIHLTKRIGGGVLVGPNAFLAFSREGYRWKDVSVADLWRILSYSGFRPMLREHWRAALTELHRSINRRAFVAEARRFVPELSVADIVPAPSGVRAQAVAADGSFIDDFAIETSGRVTSIRNAPSPAATSSLAIARFVAGQLGQGSG